MYFWLQSFPVYGWRTRSLSSVSGLLTRWRCIRGWLMRLLWAYEHDFIAISPFLSERIDTLCRHPCSVLWLEQRTTGWRSGRSEGDRKSLSAEHAPMDHLLLTQRTSRLVPGWFRWSVPRGAQHFIRSWRSHGWPLSWPEAARPSPPSSLPSTAGLPGGTRAFPRWRKWSRCTCAHETPPLRGTVRVSHPKPVSWYPPSRPKLIVLRARQPLPCTPWLSCRFTKPRHSNRCSAPGWIDT